MLLLVYPDIFESVLRSGKILRMFQKSAMRVAGLQKILQAFATFNTVNTIGIEYMLKLALHVSKKRNREILGEV